MRALIAGLAGVAILVTAPAYLAGHAVLIDAVPAPAARGPAPAQLGLRFNGRIEWRLSRIHLVGSDGSRRELPVESGGTPDRLTAALPELGEGRYDIEWQVLSADGHVVRGRYTFHVTSQGR